MEIVDPRVNPKLVPSGSRAVIYDEPRPGEPPSPYAALPSIQTPDGTVITRWHLSDFERAKILQGEDIYLAVKTFGQPLQPVALTVGPRDWSDD